MRQIYRPVPCRQVLLMHPLHFLQVVLQQRNQRSGQRRHPVLLPFPIPHHDLFHPKIQVLDPQSHRLHDAQPAAIKQLHHKLGPPSTNGTTRATSSRVNTTGTFGFRSARTASIRSARGNSNTFL